MASIDSLRSQVAAMRAKVGTPEAPRHFSLTLEEGSEIPAHVEAMIRPQDQITIRCYPAGYVAQDEGASIGWYECTNGEVTVLYGTDQEQR